MTVLDKSGQIRMKMRFRKYQHSKRKSLSTDFLDLLGRVRQKGSGKCNKNHHRYRTVSIKRIYNPLRVEKTPGSRNMMESYESILSNNN